MKRLFAIGLSLFILGGCGGNDYDEDDAYEDGYEGVRPESESNYDVWCEGLRDAIRSGGQIMRCATNKSTLSVLGISSPPTR